MDYRIEMSVKPQWQDARGQGVVRRLAALPGLPHVNGIRTRSVYTVSADITPDEAAKVAQELADPVTRSGIVGETPSKDLNYTWLIRVGFKPGVTDNVARTAWEAIGDIIGRKLTREEQVFSSIEYLVDSPEMTRELPPKITSTTGMDALTHAIEAYICWTYNTGESIRLAEEAVCEIFRYLERAYRDGNDMEARTQMLIAAYKAGFAFTRAGVGNVHAIAHTLGGLYNTPHGLANAVILPIVLEDYGAAVEEKLSHLAVITGLKLDGTTAEKAAAFIAEVRAMNRRMEIPTGFDFIKEEDIPQMVKWALAEANPVYPVPVVYDEARCEKLIRRIIAEA